MAGTDLTAVGRLLVTLVAAAALLVCAMWLFQRRLIYMPSPGPVPVAATTIPQAEDVSFTTRDGLTLGGWFFAAAVAEPGPAVLYCNGNAGDRSGRAELAIALRERGISVLLFDYRGYGGNPGSPSADGLFADATAARGYLESRPDVDPMRVVLAGESLGAAVALGVAVHRAPAGLVLRSPFTSLVDVARVHYPFLPANWLLRDRYPSLARIRELRSPLLVAAGGRDRIVPIEQSRALHSAAPGEGARLLVFEDAGHNDRLWLDGPAWIDAVVSFVNLSAGAARESREGLAANPEP